jgi:glycosyltransferase involved in cell wall biosynthesis
MQDIRVTILIPTRNRPQLLKRAIASVVAQKISRMQICVVDNNPDLEVSNIVKRTVAEYEKNNPDIFWTYLHSAELFASGARNDGMGLSAGEYICFLDDDDELLEGSIEKRVNIMQANPDLALLYCGATSVIYPYPFTIYRYYKYEKGDERLMMMSCSSAIINKQIFVDHDLEFDKKQSRMDDYDLCRRALDKGLKMHSIPDALVRINLHPDTRISSNAVISMDFKEVLIEKWGESIEEYINSYIEGIFIWRKCFGLENKNYKEITHQLSGYITRGPSLYFKIQYFLVRLNPFFFLALYHLLIIATQLYRNRLKRVL